MVDIKRNRGVLNEMVMVKDVVSEDDLHRRTLNRSDWTKFVKNTVKDTEN